MMKYTVTEFRAAGLEARWSKTRAGAPILVARNPKSEYPHQREKWWAVDAAMFKEMERVGIVEAFNNHTLLGDLFYTARI